MRTHIVCSLEHSLRIIRVMRRQQVCVLLFSFSEATCIISAAKASDKCSDNPGCIETANERGWLPVINISAAEKSHAAIINADII